LSNSGAHLQPGTSRARLDVIAPTWPFVEVKLDRGDTYDPLVESDRSRSIQTGKREDQWISLHTSRASSRSAMRWGGHLRE